MRVISGKYKGKNLQGFDIDGTRPTMDRVKESLFGIIQNYLKDSICLDLFAGSGSLGIEALSNGARKCYFADYNKEVIKILENNLKEIDNSFILNNSYEEALEKLKNEKFDIIFLDPPYKYNLITKAVNIILKNDMLNKNGIIVCEYEKENINIDLKIKKEKKYGSKNIRIYIKE